MSTSTSNHTQSDYHGAPLTTPDRDWPNGRPCWAPPRPSAQYELSEWDRTGPVNYDGDDESVEPSEKKVRHSVRRTLVAVHAAYSARIKIRDAEIVALKGELAAERKRSEELSYDLKETVEAWSAQTEEETVAKGDLEHDLDITEGELSLYQKSEKEWIGRALKLKYLLSEIKKIGALREDHAAWVFPLVDDLDFPEVSISLRDEFIPTAQTDNTDWSDEEEDGSEEDGEEEEEEVTDIVGSWISPSEGVAFATRALENETELRDESGQIIGYQHHSEAADPSLSDETSDLSLSDETSDLDDSDDDIIGVPNSAICILHSHLRQAKVIAAKKIQTAWKQFMVRKRIKLDADLDEYMTEPWPPLTVEEYCATQIQSAWRGFITRHHIAIPDL